MALNDVKTDLTYLRRFFFYTPLVMNDSNSAGSTTTTTSSTPTTITTTTTTTSISNPPRPAGPCANIPKVDTHSEAICCQCRTLIISEYAATEFEPRGKRLSRSEIFAARHFSACPNKGCDHDIESCQQCMKQDFWWGWKCWCCGEKHYLDAELNAIRYRCIGDEGCNVEWSALPGLWRWLPRHGQPKRYDSPLWES